MENKSTGKEEILSQFRTDRLGPFYTLVYPGMLLYASKMLGPEHEWMAEDCVQEVVFRAWERKRSFPSLAALKSFLYTSIRNDAVSIHRRQSAHSRYVSRLDESAFFATTVIDQEARTILFNAVGRLPEKMRQVFELNFIEGLKISEVAQRMELTESSVKKYKAQGLEILRRTLDPRLFMLLGAGLF